MPRIEVVLRVLSTSTTRRAYGAYSIALLSLAAALMASLSARITLCASAKADIGAGWVLGEQSGG
jgi:hypothetical protein